MHSMCKNQKNSINNKGKFSNEIYRYNERNILCLKDYISNILVWVITGVSNHICGHTVPAHAYMCIHYKTNNTKRNSLIRSISITSWSTNIIFSTFWWANHRNEQATLATKYDAGTEISFPINENRGFGWKGYLSWHEIAMWKTTFPRIKQLKHTLWKWNWWVEIDVWIRVTLQKLNFYEKKAIYNFDTS